MTIALNSIVVSTELGQDFIGVAMYSLTRKVVATELGIGSSSALIQLITIIRHSIPFCPIGASMS